MMAERKPAGLSKWEWAGIAALLLAVLAALKISWLKWSDPLIDFGRELYLPWRIGEGAVLYRDMDANYGPLSHYFNALIFRIAGPGLMHLVAVNLAIYGAILALVYCEVRAGWGRLAAFVCSLFFIVAFSFSQFVRVGNYNFATPYAHETTHGFLLVLALVALWASWLRRPAAWKAAAAGIACGLCALLKVEIIFAAAAVTICGIVRAFLARPEFRRAAPWLPLGGVFIAGGLLPPLIATAILWRTGAYSLREAFSWANVGWMGLFIYKNIASDPIQAGFLGTNDATGNLRHLALYGGLSLAGIAAACALCRLAGRGKTAAIAIGACLVGAAALAAFHISWTEIGGAFPAWLCLAVLLAFRPPAPNSTAANVRWLLLLAAAAFLARMALNPRIYHYGYYQAALAGIVAVATAFRTLPDRFALRGIGRVIYLVALGVFLAVGVGSLEKKSARIFSCKTQPVGEGADRFYGFAPQLEPTAHLLEEARKTLAAKSDCRSLFVLPEGIMLNYLLRKPSPTHVYMFNPYWLNWRESVVKDLARNPPDYAVVISRDLREYGVGRFGENPEHGATLVSWLNRNCRAEQHIGGDPFDPAQKGLIILKRNRN